MPDPSDPKRPRLVVPGAEADPAPARRITPPGGHAAATAGPETPAPARRPGLILPPGVGREIPEDLPEYPRLRPLGLARVSDGRREMLLVSDPLGVIPGQPVLSIEALPMLQLLDGTTSLSDITAALMRGSKDLRVAGLVRDFVAQLDELLMLDSPRFRRRSRRCATVTIRSRFDPRRSRATPTRAERAELEAFLDAHFAGATALRGRAVAPAIDPPAIDPPAIDPPAKRATGPPHGPPPPGGVPRAMLAPHLDPRRAGATIAQAMAEIGPEQTQPLRVVIFGTGHSLLGDLFALTRKHFETPLGKARCDTAFVDRVAARLGESAYRGELAHRDEHSIEFQALYLQRLLKEHPSRSCRSCAAASTRCSEEGRTPREAPEFERMIDAVSRGRAELGGPTVYVAGVDLSHVGPRFGHPPIDERREAGDRSGGPRRRSTRRSRATPTVGFRPIAAHDDRTHICGFAPTTRCCAARTSPTAGCSATSSPTSPTARRSRSPPAAWG